MTPAEIINYWYSENARSKWFNSTPEFDDELRNQFEGAWQQARDGQLDDWKQTAEGCLALAIILDQFPLNMFRGKAESFSTESHAVEISKYAIENQLDTQLETEKRVFLYMPLMHSESLTDQDMSVSMFEKTGLKENARFARHHRDIVTQYGRFPHRNEILGRESTAKELAYLDSDEAFKG